MRRRTALLPLLDLSSVSSSRVSDRLKNISPYAVPPLNHSNRCALRSSSRSHYRPRSLDQGLSQTSSSAPEIHPPIRISPHHSWPITPSSSIRSDILLEAQEALPPPSTPQNYTSFAFDSSVDASSVSPPSDQLQNSVLFSSSGSAAVQSSAFDSTSQQTDLLDDSLEVTFETGIYTPSRAPRVSFDQKVKDACANFEHEGGPGAMFAHLTDASAEKMRTLADGFYSSAHLETILEQCYNSSPKVRKRMDTWIMLKAADRSRAAKENTEKNPETVSSPSESLFECWSS